MRRPRMLSSLFIFAVWPSATATAAPSGSDDACQPSQDRTVTAPRINLWLDFTDQESRDVKNWLCSQPLLADSSATRPFGGINPSGNATYPYLNGSYPYPNASYPFPNGTNPFNVTSPFNITNPFNFTDQPLNISQLPCEYRVGGVAFLAPNKSEALLYLDGKVDTPPRYAQAWALFQEGKAIYRRSFAVGPLPISGATSMQPLYTFTRDENSRNVMSMLDFGSMSDFDNVFRGVLVGLSDIILDLTGTSLRVDAPLFDVTAMMPKIGGKEQPKHPKVPSNVTKVDALPYRSSTVDEGGRSMLWVRLSETKPRPLNTLVKTGANGKKIELVASQMNYDTNLILPQGLFFKFDISGNSTIFKGVLYNNIMYDSAASFREAWSSPGFEKTAQMKAGPWITGDRTGDLLPHDTEPGPVQVNPQARFEVDFQNKYISWMDFSFYLGFDLSSGTSLHEIRYKGDRIIYELGLQEALAHYAGNDPVQSQTVYLDVALGLGAGSLPLIRGYDCPLTATYLNASTIDFTGDTICIFERDAGFPLARHRGVDYISAIKNNVLTIRSVATLGNYDYMFDYSFYYDGTVEVTVRASGYIEGAYYAKNDDYGYRIHDALSGSMHDHVLNFKLDIDVNGTKNTLERVDIKPTTAKYSWSSEPLRTMKIERSFIENEDQGKINWSPNSESMYVVVNKEAKNPYGELRGYRLLPGVGSPIHLTAKNSSIAMQAANFATHHLYVTKQKDTEPRSSSDLNMVFPDDPSVDFNKFFDGESLDQEDLVIWFNLGMHHVPHTGDLPYTIFTTAQSSMMITPHNYLASGPGLQSNQAIKIKTNVSFDDNFLPILGKPTVTSMGGESLNCTLDLGELQPNYDNMI